MADKTRQRRAKAAIRRICDLLAGCDVLNDRLAATLLVGPAARLVRARRAERFGFITTNSLRQTFNRRVLEKHLDGSRGRSPSNANAEPMAGERPREPQEPLTPKQRAAHAQEKRLSRKPALPGFALATGRK